MFRTIARLGSITSAGVCRHQASTRMSIASFHITRSTAVTASMNAATSPSIPLPPPMTTSTLENSSQHAPSSPGKTMSTSEIASESQKGSQEDEEKRLSAAEFIPVLPEQARSLTENPVLSQLVNTIMKDGMKARSQRFVADAMLEIRSRTQSDPYQVLLDAIELASPILKLSAVKKGSKVLQVPTPMTERQRRRKAIVWILEASDKRKGEKQFKDRLASEFLAVVNGNSGALVKKNQLHKAALANRANASLKY
ncbi:hypothetical protein BGX28_000527 [Mortierella sp. GBA30]|nr:hypothetical protein BGX28_000527 [Mortierella sp. GBA30]